MSTIQQDYIKREPTNDNTAANITPRISQQAMATEVPRRITDEASATSAWGQYLNNLNGRYQEKIRDAAQQSNYNITIRYEDGREEKQVFTRMKMLQWQFDEIEDLRAEATDLTVKSPREAQKALSKMYTKAATYILFNVKKEKPMTEDEYRHCVFSEVRPALDSAMLLGLISDPN